MITSDRGLVALARHEGIVPGPYRDAGGVWTYGIGHTASAGAPDPAKMPRGMPANLERQLRHVFAVFRRDVAIFERAVLDALGREVLQHQFDALVSLAFNIGEDAVARSSAVRYLREGDVTRAADAILLWNRSGGRVLPALQLRRQAERRLFLYGEYPSGSVPVWRVDGAGVIDWSEPVDMVRPARALELLRPAPAEPAGPAWLLSLVDLLGRLVGRA